MKRYGEDFELTTDVMDAIAAFMDDEKREPIMLHPKQPDEHTVSLISILG